MNVEPDRISAPFRFKLHEDARGSLLPIEFDKLDIEPRRIFIVTGGYPGVLRGGHGPKRGAQLIVLLSGTVAVMIEHASGDRDAIKLEKPGQSIRLDTGEISWQRFADAQSRLLVIADSEFDPDAYVTAPAPLSTVDVELLATL
jgi:hypothetical protein